MGILLQTSIEQEIIHPLHSKSEYEGFTLTLLLEKCTTIAECEQFANEYLIDLVESMDFIKLCSVYRARISNIQEKLFKENTFKQLKKKTFIDNKSFLFHQLQNSYGSYPRFSHHKLQLATETRLLVILASFHILKFQDPIYQRMIKEWIEEFNIHPEKECFYTNTLVRNTLVRNTFSPSSPPLCITKIALTLEYERRNIVNNRDESYAFIRLIINDTICIEKKEFFNMLYQNCEFIHLKQNLS